MKKIILLTVVAFSAAITYGQRVVDMSTSMTSPTASTIIRTGVPFPVNFTVTNNGPDLIKTTDSIIFFMSINGTLQPLSANFKVTSDLAVSGTASFTVSNLTLTGAGGNITLCSHVILINRELPDSVKDNVIGGTGNNNSCVTLKFSGTGVGKVHLNKVTNVIASPNPATSNVTIGFTANTAEKSSIEIFDMQGRLVKTIDNGICELGYSSVDVDLTDMAKGIYIYKVNIGNTSTTDKFIVE